MDTFEAARLTSIEAIVMAQKYLLTSVLTIQMHLLVHVVNEIAIRAGVVHTPWIYLFEIFMNNLKGFVR